MSGGILLVLAILLMIATSSNPIGLSKNAFFKTQKTREIFSLPGRLVRTEDGGFLNYCGNAIKRMDGRGIAAWQKNLDRKELLWLGQKGYVTAEDGIVSMWNAEGELTFRKENFIANPEVLCFDGDYILFSGEIQKKQYAALLNAKGTVLWQVPIDGRTISGKTSESGFYTVLNVLDENFSGKIVFINSEGDLLWEIKRPVMMLCMEFVADGVEAVAEDRIFRTDYQGRVIREHIFEEPVLRADIGRDGYAAVVVNNMEAKLIAEPKAKIVMLDPGCSIKWSYALEKPPLNIKKSGEFVHIIYNDKILALSREGLLAYGINYAGAKSIDIVDSSRIIINRDDGSSLMEVSGGNAL
jgi:outer membrane protein assembly factor BamB